MKEEINKKVDALKNNSIVLNFEKANEHRRYTSHFGGVPDVPADFIWPQYYDEELAEIYSLDFLLQLNCEDLIEYDKAHILPEKGLISFFYDVVGQPHEGESNNKGCIRVFFFENPSTLVLADLPNDISQDDCLPYFSVDLSSEASYPSLEDYVTLFETTEDRNVAEYTLFPNELMNQEDIKKSKLLGWADVIQESMFENILQKENCSCNLEDWTLFLQLSSFQCGDYELLFGDAGSIFLYIKKDELKNKKYDNIHLILQC